jgi:hypothetical protein
MGGMMERRHYQSVIQRARPRLAMLAISLLIALGGCGQRDSSVPTGNAANSGPLIRAMPAGVKPSQSTFDVDWKPGTTVIEPSAVAQSFKGMAADGSMAFDGETAKRIAALPPYSVIVLSGLAVRRIARVQQVGSQLHVFTGPVALDDAIEQGHIKWRIPVDFNRVAIAMPAGFQPIERPMWAATWGGTLIPSAYADEPGYNWKGNAGDWEAKLSVTPQNGDLKFELDAKKTIGGGTLSVHGSGELDSLTNSVEITLANGSTTQISFDNSNLHGKVDFTWDATFDKQHGGDDIKEFNKPTVANLPLGFSLPFVVGPLPFKLVFRTGFAFSPIFTSKTTVAHGEAHMSFGGAASVNSSSAGDTPAAATAAGAAPPAPASPPANDSSTMQADGTIDSYGGTLSVAPLGLSTTISMPKIVLTLGVPEALDNALSEIRGLGGILGTDADTAKDAEGMARSDALTNAPGSPFANLMGKQDSGPYFDVLMQYDFVATGPLSIAACERRELKALAMVGVEASLLGKSLVRVPPKTILEKNYKLIVPSNIKLCRE